MQRSTRLEADTLFCSDANVRASDSGVFDHEMPGGQYTNLMFQSQQLGLTGQWKDVVKSYIDANQLCGDIVKVTPSSKVSLFRDLWDRGLGPGLLMPLSDRLSETLLSSLPPTSFRSRTSSTRLTSLISPTRELRFQELHKMAR